MSRRGDAAGRGRSRSATAFARRAAGKLLLLLLGLPALAPAAWAQTVTVPGAPTGFRVTAIEFAGGGACLGIWSTATIEWTVANNGGAAIDGYQLDFQQVGSSGTPQTTNTFTGDLVSPAGPLCLRKSLDFVAGNDFRMRLRNSAGFGPWSAPFRVQSPGQPTVTATGGERIAGLPDTTIRVEWTPVGGAAQSWIIEEAFTSGSSTEIATPSGNARMYDRAQRLNDSGDNYWRYQVRGASAVSGLAGLHTSVFVSSRPPAPGNLNAVADDDSTDVTLTWDAPNRNTATNSAAPLTLYRMQYRTGGGAWRDGGTVGGTSTTGTVTGPAGATAYEFRVRAETTARDGFWSDAATATTGSAEAITLQVTLAPGLSVPEGAGQLNVRLARPSGIPRTTDVRMRVDTGADASASAPADSGSDYTALNRDVILKSQRSATSAAIFIEQDAVAEGDETFAVRLSNPGGGGARLPGGAPVAETGGQRLGAAPDVSARTVTVTIADDDTAAGAPMNLATDDSSGVAGRVDLTWTAPGDTGMLDGATAAVTGWQYRTATAQAGLSSASWVDTGSSAAGHTVNGLAGGQTHWFQVRAVTGVTTPAGDHAGAVSDAAMVAGTPVPGTNTPATGALSIAGTAQVGQVLTADAGDIADADGLTGVSYSWQWIRVESDSTENDISGATGATYTPVAADVGRTLKVRAGFTDDAGNAESRTSAATAVVVAASVPGGNTAATGAPAVSGTAQVGRTLTAGPGDIADADGLTGVSYSWQWIRMENGGPEEDISGATGATYTPVTGDVGRTLRVRAGFTDDAGNAESRTSPATAAVKAAATLDVSSIPLTEADLDGAMLTVTLSEAEWANPLPSGAVTVSGIRGLSVGQAARKSGSEVTVTLAFDGDFDADASFRVQALAAALAGTGPGLASEPVTVTPRGEALSATVDGNCRWTFVADPDDPVNGVTVTLEGPCADPPPDQAPVTVTVTDPLPDAPLPAGVTGEADTVLDIAASGAVPVEVCLPHERGRGTPALFRFADGEGWTEAPARHVRGDLVCARPAAFSPFAVFYRQASTEALLRSAKAWLSRFARTASNHAMEAIGRRFSEPAEDGVTVAGRRLAVAPASGPGPRAVADRPLYPPLPASGERGIRDAQALTPRELLAGTSFRVSAAEGEGAEARGWTAWGRGQAARFDLDGEGIDGDVATGTIGLDFSRNRLTAGAALAHSTGDGTISAAASGSGPADRRDVEATLTSVHPYLHYEGANGVSVWGVLGYGSGDFTIVGPEGGEASSTDTDMTMAGVGLRGPVREPSSPDGLALALRAEAFAARIETDGGDLDGLDGDARQLRLVLEGRWAEVPALGPGFAPSFELGLRHEGGDDGERTGAELGAGLSWTGTSGVAAELRTRLLLAEDGLAEWGAGGSVRYAARTDGRGPSLTLTPSFGASEGRAERLWGAEALSAATGGGKAGLQFDAEAGWGFAALDGAGLLTPYAGFGLGQEDDRRYRIGMRLDRGPGISTELAAERAETAANPEHVILLRATLRW